MIELMLIVMAAIIFSVVGGLVDGWNWRRHQNISSDDKEYYNKLWHRLKPVRDLSCLFMGAMLVIDSDLQINIIAADLVLVISIYWIMFDVGNYKGMGVNIPFLQVSDWAKKGKNGLFGLEKYSTPIMKVILFDAAVGYQVYIFLE